MANGTIAFDTLQTSGQIKGSAKSLDTDYLAYGSTKVWCNYKADSESINGSLNLTSVSDFATCNYGYNFTNNMADDDYCPTGYIRDGSDNTHLRCVQSTDGSNFTTSQLTVRPAGVNASDYLTNFDPLDICITIVGDIS